MTTEQTRSKRINWSAVMTAIGAVAAHLAAINFATTGIDWQHLLWSCAGIAIAAYKGTARGSLAKKPKPATLDSADPVGRGG